MSSAWFGADSTNGTAAYTNGSTDVVLTGANLLTNKALAAGAAQYGLIGADGKLYGIQAVTGENELTLMWNYGGTTASGAFYAIVPVDGATVALLEAVNDLISNSNVGELNNVSFNANDLLQYLGGTLTNRSLIQVLVSLLSNLSEVNVASASTCDIGASGVLSPKIQITGTTAITSFGTATNCLRILRFAGALTLTYDATHLITLTGANRTTAAGDIAIYMSDSSGNWREVHYSRAGANQNINGYLRVGSASAPANTTAGDLTATRLSVGNSALSGPGGQIMNVAGSVTDTSGTGLGALGFIGISPAANSTANFAAAEFEANLNSSTFNISSIRGIEGMVNVTSVGTVSLSIGVQGVGLSVGNGASALGTVTEVAGGHFQGLSNFGSNTLTSTISLVEGIHIAAPGNAGAGPLVITNNVGATIASMTAGSNNTDLLLGTLTAPSGNFGIYQGDTYTNRFGGPLDISGSSSGQIKFPSSANLSSNANTLDDFEEGTFTPTFVASTGTYTPTYGSQVGWYRKVASQVTVGGVVSTTAFTGTPTGRMSIGGLPFTCTSTSNAGIAVSGQLMDSGINSLIANMTVSAAAIALFKFSGGAPSDIGSVFTQTQNVQFGGSYITAS